MRRLSNTWTLPLKVNTNSQWQLPSCNNWIWSPETGKYVHSFFWQFHTNELLPCIHNVIVQPTIFIFQDFPIYVCELIQLILEPWRRTLRGWLIRLTHFRFPEDSIYGIPGMFPSCQDEPRGLPFFITDTTW